MSISLTGPKIFIPLNGMHNDETTWTILSSLAHPMKLIVFPYFRLLQGIGLCGYGLKEILFNGPRNREFPVCQRVSQAVKDCFSSIRNGVCSAEFHIKHGLLLMGAGISGIACAAHGLKIVDMGFTVPVLKRLDFGLFLAACLVALKHNVDRFWEAPPNSHERRVAVLGIVSSLNYVIWGTCILIESSTLMALVFCFFGMATGGLKALYEFFGPMCSRH